MHNRDIHNISSVHTNVAYNYSLIATHVPLHTCTVTANKKNVIIIIFYLLQYDYYL